MAPKIFQHIGPLEEENRKKLGVIGVIAGVVVLVTIVSSAILYFANRGDSEQLVDLSDIERAYLEGEGTSDEFFDFIAKEPIVTVDGHPCYEAAARATIHAACDWDDDGKLLPEDFDLAKTDLPIVETGNNRLVRDDAGVFYSEVRVNDTANCLGMFYLGETMPVRIQCQKGALGEDFILEQREPSTFVDQMQSQVAPEADLTDQAPSAK